MSDIVLDKDGNINTEKLEKSLRSALDFDVKYKQTDSMKKRACKVAADYTEFKAMVACAHLKTLPRKEIETLKTAKKGWQKEKLEAGASILAQEVNHTTQPVNLSATLNNSVVPKTSRELLREFKLLTDSTQMFNLLCSIGTKKVKKMLNGDCDTELVEAILEVFVLLSDNTISTEVEQQPSLECAANVDIADWLIIISNLNRFDLTLRFLNTELLARIQLLIATLPDTLDKKNLLCTAYGGDKQ